MTLTTITTLALTPAAEAVYTVWVFDIGYWCWVPSDTIRGRAAKHRAHQRMRSQIGTRTKVGLSARHVMVREGDENRPQPTPEEMEAAGTLHTLRAGMRCSGIYGWMPGCPDESPSAYAYGRRSRYRFPTRACPWGDLGHDPLTRPVFERDSVRTRYNQRRNGWTLAQSDRDLAERVSLARR